MSKDEFFAFMPLLIYGIAISELVMHWRDYLKSDRRYWPHLISGLFTLEVVFLNFYFLYDKLDLLFENYYAFLFRLTSPLVMLLAVSVYTPEPEKSVKAYFLDKMPTFFSLLALFITLNMLQELVFNSFLIIRLITIAICLLIAYTKKVWLIYLLIFYRFVMVFIDLNFHELIY
jgi:hypothetical protein